VLRSERNVLGVFLNNILFKFISFAYIITIFGRRCILSCRRQRIENLRNRPADLSFIIVTAATFDRPFSHRAAPLHEPRARSKVVHPPPLPYTSVVEHRRSVARQRNNNIIYTCKVNTRLQRRVYIHIIIIITLYARTHRRRL